MCASDTLADFARWHQVRSMQTSLGARDTGHHGSRSIRTFLAASFRDVGDTAVSNFSEHSAAIPGNTNCIP
jgi:hypothetical protein